MAVTVRDLRGCAARGRRWMAQDGSEWAARRTSPIWSAAH